MKRKYRWTKKQSLEVVEALAKGICDNVDIYYNLDGIDWKLGIDNHWPAGAIPGSNSFNLYANVLAQTTGLDFVTAAKKSRAMREHLSDIVYMSVNQEIAKNHHNLTEDLPVNDGISMPYFTILRNLLAANNPANSVSVKGLSISAEDVETLVKATNGRVSVIDETPLLPRVVMSGGVVSSSNTIIFNDKIKDKSAYKQVMLAELEKEVISMLNMTKSPGVEYPNLQAGGRVQFTQAQILQSRYWNESEELANSPEVTKALANALYKYVEYLDRTMKSYAVKGAFKEGIPMEVKTTINSHFEELYREGKIVYNVFKFPVVVMLVCNAYVSATKNSEKSFHLFNNTLQSVLEKPELMNKFVK